MKIRGQKSSKHDIVNLYNFTSTIRNRVETTDKFNMKLVFDWLSDFVAGIDKSEFPLAIYNQVIGLLGYMSQPGNLRYDNNINTIQWQYVIKGLDSIEAELRVSIEEMRKYSKNADGSDMYYLASVTSDYDSIIPKSQFMDTTGNCDLNAVDPVYGDINEQFTDSDYVYQNKLNFADDDQWITHVTPSGQTGYDYNVAHGKQRPLDPNCLAAFRRGRNTVQIENETRYLRPFGCDRKDQRFARPGLNSTVRNAPSINDFNGWKRTYV